MIKKYLEQKLTYTDDGRLLDETGRAIMMEWETEWMKYSAHFVCQNGGDILNIGFGMGIIDNFIESYNINSHTIIEPHPDVYKKMISDGWGDKKNVKIINARWQDVLFDLPKFDGIYFDTWQDNGFFQMFLPNLKKILKPNGIFSYWEGLSPNDVNEKTKQILHKDFIIDKKSLKLDKSQKNIEIHNYYKWEECVIPIITHRNKPIIKNLL